MPAVQYIVEGGRTLTARFAPSGNKNAALPIVAAALLSRQARPSRERPAHPRRRDAGRAHPSVGASAEWTAPQLADASTRKTVHARGPRSRALREDPRVDSARRAAARPLRRDQSSAAGRRRHRPPAARHALPRARAARREASTFDEGLLRLSAPGFTRRRRFSRRAERHRHRERARRRRRGEGTTVLRNAASEPHVQDLAHFLVALGAQHRGHRHEHAHDHGGRPLGERMHAHDRPRSHRGRLVHRARRRHALGDHASRAPASSICARRSWASSGSASSASIEGDDLVVPAKQEMEIQSDLGGHVPEARGSAVAGVPGRYDVDRARHRDAVRRA